jgi:hypothetical protein
MKSIATIILGLLLVISAAAGNSNTANVAATSNMAGQDMVNADFVQVNDIEADLLGNSICAEQISNMEAIDNILVGSEPDGNTFFLQSIDQSISDTGNNNVDTQNVGIPGTIKKVLSIVDCDDSFNSGLIAIGNTLTDSSASQIISQNETIEGNDNLETQNVGVSCPAKFTLSAVCSDDSFNSGLIALDNTLTGSVSNQIIRQDEMTEGNNNVDIQNVGVPSSIDVTACAITSDNSFNSGLISVENTMTDSVSNQILCQNEQVKGNDNLAIQNAGVPCSIKIGLYAVCGDDSFNSGLISADNTMTGSFANQVLSQNEKIEGNNNVDRQNVGVPDPITRILCAVTDTGSFDSGIIAVDNILTNSVANQMISQNDMDTGNSNDVTQLADMKMITDVLTGSGALQKIEEDVQSLGDANTFSQNVAFTNKANIVTDGNIIQQAYASSS